MLVGNCQNMAHFTSRSMWEITESAQRCECVCKKCKRVKSIAHEGVCVYMCMCLSKGGGGSESKEKRRDREGEDRQENETQ